MNIKPIEVTITVAELEQLAASGQRMLNYIRPGDSLLLTVLHGSNGCPVKVMINRECFIKKHSLFDSS